MEVKNGITGKVIASGDTLREIVRANLAYLCGANLSGANLESITLCGATIDGAVVINQDIGGPGNILCALTADEWKMISEGRST